MIQWAIVIVLVIASAIYATWSLLPARTRLTLLDSVLGRMLPPAASATLRRRTLAELSGGCGSCAGGEQAHSAKPVTGKRP